MTKIPITVITGPTASGKTALSVKIAKAIGGEIICADSMQIYKGMDIATAKPTAEEMDGVPHHLVDFVGQGEEFSVAEYVRLAHKAAYDIYSRNKPVIVCGGTGLYIDSFIENIQFQETVSETAARSELKELAEEKGNAYLLEMLREIDPETASRLHENNLSRIIRAIEIYRATGKTMSEQIKLSRSAGSPYRVLEIALDYSDREKLYERIDRRVDEMLKNGLLEEAESVLSGGGLRTARQAIGYKELSPWFSGELPLKDCIEALKRSTRRYAKRQLTWIRRNKDVVWLYPDRYDSADGLFNDALRLIKDFLSKED